MEQLSPSGEYLHSLQKKKEQRKSGFIWPSLPLINKWFKEPEDWAHGASWLWLLINCCVSRAECNETTIRGDSHRPRLLAPLSAEQTSPGNAEESRVGSCQLLVRFNVTFGHIRTVSICRLTRFQKWNPEQSEVILFAPFSFCCLRR